MLNSIVRLLVAAFCLALLPVQAEAPARTKVVVATDSWAQLMFLDNKNVPRGVLAEFIYRMNEVQDKFQFELVIYPRLRLDTVFLEKQADVYPLRTTLWTNPAFGLLPTKTIFSSGDVYFAKRDNRFGGAKIFSNLKARSIAGVRGYHYQVFNNNPDETYIKKNFNAYLVASNEAVINFVLADRAEVGIVPEVIIAKYLEDPAMRAQLIVADDFDSRVEFSNLVRKGGPISVDDMNAIIELMIKAGDVDKLKTKLSIQQYQSPKK